MIKHGGSVTTKHKEFLREQVQKTQSTLLKGRRRPVRGWIIAMRPIEGDDYYHQVRVRIDGPNNSDKVKISTMDTWLPLIEDPAVVAMLYGDKDMIVGSRCRVEFSGASPRNGQVYIEYDRRRAKKPRKQATELDQKAFLYAPAGGGKLF